MESHSPVAFFSSPESAQLARADVAVIPNIFDPLILVLPHALPSAQSSTALSAPAATESAAEGTSPAAAAAAAAAGMSAQPDWRRLGGHNLHIPRQVPLIFDPLSLVPHTTDGGRGRAGEHGAEEGLARGRVEGLAMLEGQGLGDVRACWGGYRLPVPVDVQLGVSE